MTAPVSVTIWLRSWLYLFVFLAWTILAAVLFLPLLITRRSTLTAVRLWTGGIMIIARVVAGITNRIVGREYVPPGPCIIAAQHQSSFETYALFHTLERPIFILKRELMWIPLIGWYMMRAGFVGIDRNAGAGAMRKVIREARAALAKGHQAVVFPEGTRVLQGETQPYRPGVAALYAMCAVPVIPMALNSGYFWGKTRILKIPGDIVFRFLPALPTGLDKDAMLADLRVRLESATL